jgi:hypothetical protein
MITKSKSVAVTPRCDVSIAMPDERKQACDAALLLASLEETKFYRMPASVAVH